MVESKKKGLLASSLKAREVSPSQDGSERTMSAPPVPPKIEVTVNVNSEPDQTARRVNSSRGLRRVRYASMDTKVGSEEEEKTTPSSKESRIIESEMVPRSLKESTLRGLIVSHRDWQGKRFNTLLNEEIRLSNESFSRQALLYDPIVADLTLHLLSTVQALLPKDGGEEVEGPHASDIAESVIHIFQHVVVRRAHAQSPSTMDSWLNNIQTLLEASPQTASNILEELIDGQPKFHREDRKSTQGEMVSTVTSQLDRLQVLSKAITQVGRPLISSLGFQAQIFECDCKSALAASLRLFSAALQVVAKQLQPNAEQLVEKLFAALLKELPNSATHSSLIEIYTETWAAFCSVDSKLVLKVATKLETSAHLVHLMLGINSPGKKLDPSSRILPSLGVPEGAAVPSASGAIRALSKLINTPILGPLSNNMLASEQLRNMLWQGCSTNPAKSDHRDFLIILCELGFAKMTDVTKLALSLLSENIGFVQYQQTSERAAKANVARFTLRRLAEIQNTEDSMHQFLNQITQSSIDCLKNPSSPDADLLELAQIFAKQVESKMAKFGVPQFLLCLIATIIYAFNAKKDLAQRWFEENIQNWSPLATLVELVIFTTRPYSVIAGLTETFLLELLADAEKLKKTYIPEEPGDSI